MSEPPADAAHDALAPPVRALFGALDHAGDPAAECAGRWLSGQAGSEQHGTRVRFALCILGPGHAGAGAYRVIQARYRAYGCPYTLAACEWVARQLQDCELAALSALALAQALGGPLQWAESLAVPPERLGRLLVIEDALRAALVTAAADGDGV